MCRPAVRSGGAGTAGVGDPALGVAERGGAVADPLTTEVPMKTQLASSSARSACFSAG